MGLAGNLLLFLGPVVVCAVWGIAQAFNSHRLGGEESSGMQGPCLTLGLILAPLLTLAFVYRIFGSFADAIDDVGGPKLFVGVAAIATIGIIPTALGCYGIMAWVNGLAIADREQTVECKAGSAWRAASRRGGRWTLPYSCDVAGDHLLGSLTMGDRPAITDGTTFRVRAARGRFGYWVKLEEPSFSEPPPPPPPPP